MNGKGDQYRIRVDAALKDKFLAVADAHDRTGAQLVRDFMRNYILKNKHRVEKHKFGINEGDE